MPAYRDDVDALAARHAALATEVARKTARGPSTPRRACSTMRRPARGCPSREHPRRGAVQRRLVDEMTGDERVRACGACNKNVYNLSDMTRDEAESLIIGEGRQAVRALLPARGRHDPLKDCAVGMSKRRRRRRLGRVRARGAARGVVRALVARR